MRVQFEGKANLGGWNLRSVAEVPGCDGIVRTHQCVSQWWWFISVEEDGKRQAGPGGVAQWVRWVPGPVVGANSGLNGAEVSRDVTLWQWVALAAARR